MDAPGLSKEFLDTFNWDRELRRLLFHSEFDVSPATWKKLRYHIDKNGLHKDDVLRKIIEQGSTGVSEIEKLYGLGNPELLYVMGNVHIELIPKVARRELLRLIASETLHDAQRPHLAAMLGAVEERLADGSWA